MHTCLHACFLLYPGEVAGLRANYGMEKSKFRMSLRNTLGLNILKEAPIHFVYKELPAASLGYLSLLRLSYLPTSTSLSPTRFYLYI